MGICPASQLLLVLGFIRDDLLESMTPSRKRPGDILRRLLRQLEESIQRNKPFCMGLIYYPKCFIIYDHISSPQKQSILSALQVGGNLGPRVPRV